MVAAYICFECFAGTPDVYIPCCEILEVGMGLFDIYDGCHSPGTYSSLTYATPSTAFKMASVFRIPMRSSEAHGIIQVSNHESQPSQDVSGRTNTLTPHLKSHHYCFFTFTSPSSSLLLFPLLSYDPRPRKAMAIGKEPGQKGVSWSNIAVGQYTLLPLPPPRRRWLLSWPT